MPIETISAVVCFNADLVRSRNRVAGLILREFPQATHVLWWDDDVFPADRSIVKTMMATGEDVISAPYSTKSKPSRWVHQLLDPCPQEADGLQEVRYIGFGFAMTSTRALRKLTMACRIYTDHPAKDKIANLFGQLYEPTSADTSEDALLSEDHSFCKRWREMDGRVVLYTRCGLLYHAGGYAWSAKDIPGGVVESEGGHRRTRAPLATEAYPGTHSAPPPPVPLGEVVRADRNSR
jgi:hypothetical protein